jgi:hypothetical protein
MLRLFIFAALVFMAHGGLASSDKLQLSSYPFLMLEHININSGGLWNSTLDNFYINGLGFVYDPRSVGALERTINAGGSTQGLKWCNIGLQQIHLPSDAAQRINGYIGLLYNNLTQVSVSLQLNNIPVEEVRDSNGSLLCVETHCPVGNIFRLYQAGQAAIDADHHSICGAENAHNTLAPCDQAPSWLGPAAYLPTADAHALPGGRSVGLGISHLTLYCAPQRAASICAFYSYFFLASAYASTDPETGEPACVVPVGHGQYLRYTERGGQLPPYDGHHIAVYVQDFAALYSRLAARGLHWDNPRFPQFSYASLQDALRHQEFRIKNLVDPATNETVYELEHEIRYVVNAAGCFFAG